MLYELQANLNKIRERLRGAVVSIEAPNEPDQQGVSEWIARTRVFQRELWSRVKGDPALAHLRVVGPAVVHPAQSPALGDLSAALDQGNMHPYSGGGTPLHTSWRSACAPWPFQVPSRRGHRGGLPLRSHHHQWPLPASERAIATYTRAWRSKASGRRGCDVHLRMAEPMAAGWAASQRPALENSFGLLRGDLTPKALVLALRNLMRVVHAGSAPVAAPGVAALGLEGAPPDLRQLLLRSADGSFSLVLWREVSVWDRIARRDLAPAADHSRWLWVSPWRWRSVSIPWTR